MNERNNTDVNEWINEQPGRAGGPGPAGPAAVRGAGRGVAAPAADSRPPAPQGALREGAGGAPAAPAHLRLECGTPGTAPGNRPREPAPGNRPRE